MGSHLHVGLFILHENMSHRQFSLRCRHREIGGNDGWRVAHDREAGGLFNEPIFATFRAKN